MITVGAARWLAGKLVDAFGARIDDPVAASLGLTRAFPTPQSLVGQDIPALGPRSRGGGRWRPGRGRGGRSGDTSHRGPTWIAPWRR